MKNYFIDLAIKVHNLKICSFCLYKVKLIVRKNNKTPNNFSSITYILFNVHYIGCGILCYSANDQFLFLEKTKYFSDFYTFYSSILFKLNITWSKWNNNLSKWIWILSKWNITWSKWNNIWSKWNIILSKWKNIWSMWNIIYQSEKTFDPIEIFFDQSERCFIKMKKTFDPNEIVTWSKWNIIWLKWNIIWLKWNWNWSEWNWNLSQRKWILCTFYW